VSTTCATQQTLGRCTLRYCLSRSGCWYEVNGSRISCSSCTNISGCANTAVQRLTACSRGG
jgi:hypothetical protein